MQNAAGFEKVIFIIKKEQEDLFREAVGDRVSEYMEVSYAYQEINNIPAGFQVPEGRVKPWGTAHAVYSCKDMIDGRLQLSMQTIIMEERHSSSFMII